METRKRFKIGLIISIVLFVITIVALCVVDPYSYANVDLSREDNKIAQVYDVSVDTTKSDEENLYDVDLTIKVKNITKDTLKNVEISILLRDEAGKEIMVNCEAIELQPRIEKEQTFTCESDGEHYKVVNVFCKIDGGEEFEMLEIDELCPSNPIYMAVAVVMLVALISLIVCGVRLKKINKKLAQIEAEAFEKRADEIVDLQIQAAKQELQQNAQTLQNSQATNINTQPENSTLQQSIQEPDKIVCDYCGRLNDKNAERCSSCNSILRR